MSYEPQEQRISQEDLDKFAKRLNEWSTSLSTDEQALLGIVLGRANASDPGDVDEETYEFPSFGDVTREMLRPIVGETGSFVDMSDAVKWKDWRKKTTS